MKLLVLLIYKNYYHSLKAFPSEQNRRQKQARNSVNALRLHAVNKVKSQNQELYIKSKSKWDVTWHRLYVHQDNIAAISLTLWHQQAIIDLPCSWLTTIMKTLCFIFKDTVNTFSPLNNGIIVIVCVLILSLTPCIRAPLRKATAAQDGRWNLNRKNWHACGISIQQTITCKEVCCPRPIGASQDINLICNRA
jgi:hypothetical protein